MAYMNFRPEDTAEEQWKPMPGYEVKYYISSLGRIYSRASDKFLSVRGNTVTLSDYSCNTHRHRISELVAEAFPERRQA